VHFDLERKFLSPSQKHCPGKRCLKETSMLAIKCSRNILREHDQSKKRKKYCCDGSIIYLILEKINFKHERSMMKYYLSHT